MAFDLTRREMMATATAAAGLAIWPTVRSLTAGEAKPRFKIGACDWSIGMRHQLEALEVAKRIGLDGVEVSFGSAEEEYDLRKESVRREYAQSCERLGLEIGSLAMGILNKVPYSTHPDAEKMVEDCVAVMAAMGQKRVLLAFFGSGEIKDKPELQEKVIRRLKKVAPKAEKAGVVLGLETRLNADEHRRILDAVGSPAVQVYYDVANMRGMGYDIYREIRQLGAERICQFHMKEQGALLGQGEVDFPRVKEAIDEIGYSGWLIIEGATIKTKSREECYTANQKYLRSIFPTDG